MYHTYLSCALRTLIPHIGKKKFNERTRSKKYALEMVPPTHCTTGQIRSTEYPITNFFAICFSREEAESSLTGRTRQPDLN